MEVFWMAFMGYLGVVSASIVLIIALLLLFALIGKGISK